MKKILSFFIIFTFLTVPLCYASTPKIVDDADLLTTSQQHALEIRAQEFADAYGIDIVIVTVDSLEGKSARDFADDYFDFGGYGIGEDYSGILLLLSMEYRDWWISTCGKGIQALNDYDIQALFQTFSGYLSEGEYYPAFDAYLTNLEDYLIEATQPPGFMDYALRIVISMLVGAAVGGIAIYFMRRSMNTARKQHGAQSYVVSGSYDLITRRDMFLYSRTSRVQRQQSSSGGSTHRSSSGRSHGGGGGRF